MYWDAIVEEKKCCGTSWDCDRYSATYYEKNDLKVLIFGLTSIGRNFYGFFCPFVE